VVYGIYGMYGMYGMCSVCMVCMVCMVRYVWYVWYVRYVWCVFRHFECGVSMSVTVVTLVQGKMEDVTLPVEKVDIIIRLPISQHIT